jgi:hypothetical protein
MPDRPQAILRVEPHQIPALRAAFATAMRTVGNQLELLRIDGQIPQPWMGDPVSANVARIYHSQVMDAANPNSTIAHLAAYRDELVQVHETLAAMEADYRRTEGDNVALWGSGTAGSRT